MKRLFWLVALALSILVVTPVMASGGDVTNDGIAPVTAVDGLDVAAQHVVPVICTQAHEALLPSVDTPENRFVNLTSSVSDAQTYMYSEAYLYSENIIGHSVMQTFYFAFETPGSAASLSGKRVWDNAIKFTS